MRARGLLGAALGAGAGVGAWALAVSLVGFWTGFLALGVGALAGLGSRKLGGKGGAAAIGAAVLAAVGIFAGFGFAARRTVEDAARARAATVDQRAYDKFKAAAEEWNPRFPDAEVGRFAQRHELLPGTPLDGPGKRVAGFRATVIPALEAWKKQPPTFEAWQAERRAAILAEGDAPWAAYLGAPMDYLSPLDLLCALLGAGAAGWFGSVREAPVIRRVSRPGAPGPI